MRPDRFAQIKISPGIRGKETVGKCGVFYQRVRVLFPALVIFCMTACGKQADTVYEADKENPIEGAAEPQSGIEEETRRGTARRTRRMRITRRRQTVRKRTSLKRTMLSWYL